MSKPYQMLKHDPFMKLKLKKLLKQGKRMIHIILLLPVTCYLVRLSFMLLVTAFVSLLLHILKRDAGDNGPALFSTQWHYVS